MISLILKIIEGAEINSGGELEVLSQDLVAFSLASLISLAISRDLLAFLAKIAFVCVCIILASA